MRIDSHRHYDKMWAKLTIRQQEKVSEALELLSIDAARSKLRLHQLRGKYYPQYSVSAGGDLRVHFLYLSEDHLLLMFVGTHSQLYG